MDLLEYVRSHCEHNGISFETTEGKTIPYPGSGLPVAGFFVEKDGKARLGVALGVKSRDELLLHEFCHLVQWAGGSPYWTANALSPAELDEMKLPPGSEAVDALDAWTEGTIELTPEQVEDIANRAAMVELDCEHAVCALGPLHIPGFDAKAYARKSAAYVRLYKFVQENRRWGVPGHPPYEDARLQAIMPDDLGSVDCTNPLSSVERAAYREYVNRCQAETGYSPKFDLLRE